MSHYSSLVFKSYRLFFNVTTFYILEHKENVDYSHDLTPFRHAFKFLALMV